MKIQETIFFWGVVWSGGGGEVGGHRVGGSGWM